jgi:hypothetical protein
MIFIFGAIQRIPLVYKKEDSKKIFVSSANMGQIYVNKQSIPSDEDRWISFFVCSLGMN